MTYSQVYTLDNKDEKKERKTEYNHAFNLT